MHTKHDVLCGSYFYKVVQLRSQVNWSLAPGASHGLLVLIYKFFNFGSEISNVDAVIKELRVAEQRGSISDDRRVLEFPLLSFLLLLHII